METITAPTRFLSRILRYETEQPFFAMVTPEAGFDKSEHAKLSFTISTCQLLILEAAFQSTKLAGYGSEVVPHTGKHLTLKSLDEVETYKTETAELPRGFFQRRAGDLLGFQGSSSSVFSWGSTDLLQA
jgi:hypothetical protein